MLPFITSYDPLGGSSGSIDPLGALQAYGALADMLLPGVTTITTRSRYLSMLCAALDNAEQHHRFLPGPSGLTQRRKAVEGFERLWALGCVAAREQGIALAADGLRGITYADKTYRKFAKHGRKVTLDFKLLKYQSRTGAVGTYWTSLVGGELAHADSGALASEGKDVASEFPEPPLTAKDRRRLADPQAAHRVSLAFDNLIEWAECCHFVAANRVEREHLSDALTADDRRDCVAQALRKMADTRGLPDTWDTATVQQLLQELRTCDRARKLDLPGVVNAILVTERFHEAALAIFQLLLWWGTQHSSQQLSDLTQESGFRQATDHCRESAQVLLKYRDACNSSQIREAMEGLRGFAYAVERAESARHVVDEILQRHHKVQSGKLDGGVPKRDWVTLDGGKVVRPSPRFQRTDRPPVAAGKSLTHPYRLEPFIHMLRENDALPQPN